VAQAKPFRGEQSHQHAQLCRGHQRVDDGIGQIMQKLKELALDKNTLVVFSADQGLNAGHGGYWGMGDHSNPINTQEATVRIPLIFRHPAKSPPEKLPTSWWKITISSDRPRLSSSRRQNPHVASVARKSFALLFAEQQSRGRT